MNNEIIKKHLKDFIKEENDLMKRIKNLIIKCIEDNFISFEKLIQNKEYHIWNLYPTCVLTFEGIDEILKIEKEKKEYDNGTYYEYNVFGKEGIIVRCGITKISLKNELLEAFKNNNLAKEIINYLYSGKSVETFDHKSWKACIK